ncbi:MAG: serine/threonine-protein kinase [Microbacteriaceae bacterium]
MKRAPSTPPEIVGYEYIKHLGAGGFADVFLYRQKLPKRQVAVKVLLHDELGEASRDAFVAEANVMAQLSAHPYIVSIYQADVAPDGRPYFVMEYCSGPSLGEQYKRQTFSVADALRTGVRLSSAIATAHSAGILHRDIKPANVLTNDYGWPALTDFGIASTVEDDLPVNTMSSAAMPSSPADTGSQSVGLSIPWSPPEMFGEDPQPDVRSDVFSLAATMYTILSGRTPFEIAGRSNGTLDLINRIERGQVTPMSRDDVPRSLLAVLQKGMATRRDDRFASAVDFARALQRVELELGYAPTGIEVPNVRVVAEQREAGDDADETRVRSVSTIAAQPLISSDNDDETRLRPVTYIAPPVLEPRAPRPALDNVDAAMIRSRPQAERMPLQPVAAGATGAVASDPQSAPPLAPPLGDGVSAAAAAPTSKRGLITGLVSAAVLLVIGAIVAIAVLNSGSNVRDNAGPTPTPTRDSTDSAIGGELVPQPEDGVATPSANGSSVTFTWTNPEPQKGDTFRYARSEQPSALLPLEGASVTIDGLNQGQRQCVDVYVMRTGKLSPVPLTICFPK